MANKLNKDLLNKTNEELCILVFRLKLQLLEFRFRKQTGDFNKIHLISEIRKTIARVLTILKTRSIKLTIGTHGIFMYDNKNKTVKSLNDAANEVMKETPKAFEQQADANAPVKEVVDKEVKSIIKTEDNVLAKKAAVKKTSQVKVKKAAIRKTQGGSN
ncbi:MAG: 50S ribosomal protein L29 [Mycoplasmataceae bacterium]|jgi:large subunit ribosomal protein L29|nr:50S ribosomal protein L29 [Mycoplasmataceae bacterium]